MSNTRKTIGGLREITRLFAVQVMYGADILQKPIAEVLTHEYLNKSVVISEEIFLDTVDTVFLKGLLDEYSAHATLIDEIILKHLSRKWTIDRLNKVLIAVLRLGITELLYLDTPANVAFNEYIEISKAYFQKSEVAFVNGILNSAYKENSEK